MAEPDPIAFEFTRYRMRVIQIGLLATTAANAIFAASRFVDAAYNQRATPWWVNAASFIVLLGIYRWFTRDPAERAVFTIHTTAFIATTGLLVPLAYGMSSSIWWLSLVGLAMILMANFRAAVFWCATSWLLIALAPSAAEHLTSQVSQTPEHALEATLSRLFFPLVVFAIAYAFRIAVRQQARQLRSTATKLELSDATKGRFLSHMGHEFRTPLHALLVSTEQALNNENDPLQRGRIESAQASAQLLLRQVNQVLEFASGVAEPRQPVATVFSPPQAISRCVSGLRTMAEETRTTVTTAISEDLAPNYLGDALCFDQLLVGLSTNAVRFTPNGTVSIRLEPGADSTVRLIIADTGQGMSPEQITRAFEPFGRVDESSTRSAHGLGLGLPYIKRMISQMGGSLSCESTLGHGTTMLVNLPLRALDPNHVPAVPDKAASTKSARLLVCEDDIACRDLLVAGLQALGHRTIEACDGAEAIDLLGEQTFDAIISDLEMPRMDGRDLLKRVRASTGSQSLSASLPVILVTASATPENIAEFLDLGFDAVLPKPFMLREMQEALGRSIAQS